VVTIVGKSWPLHVEQVMDNTLQENLAMIRDSVAYLKGKGREVIYDAEHFFDAYPSRSHLCHADLVGGGPKRGRCTIVLCDTNGGTLPFDIEAIVAKVKHIIFDRI
jgi:2-isopropylmalate synthase